MLAELFADDADDPEPLVDLSDVKAPGLVDLSDVKAPGLVDREHLYDPEPGITYGCPGALLERVATLEGLVRELYITIEHSGCDLRLVARAREMVPDEGPP
jgi:hypothetical protein